MTPFHSRRRPPKVSSATRAATLPDGQEKARRDRGRTREAILTAAIDLYAREGYGAVTMRAIANQLGFSAPAIYNYFLKIGRAHV